MTIPFFSSHEFCGVLPKANLRPAVDTEATKRTFENSFSNSSLV
jgi:hypothetical protein